MTNIKWCDTWDSSSCITDGQINNMINFILHSKITDFIVYKNITSCLPSTQVFKFRMFEGDSVISGQAGTGTNLMIRANDTDSCSKIYLEGNGDAFVNVYDDKAFYVSSCSDVQWLKVDKDGIYFKGTAVCLEPCGGGGGSTDCPVKGDLPYHLYNDCATEDEKGFQFSLVGTLSIFEGSDDANDDLVIRANSSDKCSKITLEGAGNIIASVAVNSRFKVSTCTDKTLFEVVTSASTDTHIDHHCNECRNFKLECRDSDPADPCTGQMWFRTDI